MLPKLIIILNFGIVGSFILFLGCESEVDELQFWNLSSDRVDKVLFKSSNDESLYEIVNTIEARSSIVLKKDVSNATPFELVVFFQNADEGVYSKSPSSDTDQNYYAFLILQNGSIYTIGRRNEDSFRTSVHDFIMKAKVGLDEK